MKKKDIGFLKKLIGCNTDASEKKDYEKCCRIIEKELNRIGVKHERINGRDGEGRTVSNVIARIPAKKGNAKKFLIASHYDVVPPGEGWSTPPFKPILKKGRIYGRGASDDKGAILSIMMALEEIKNEENLDWEIIAVFSGDEEVSGEHGMGEVMGKGGMSADFALVADGTQKPIIGASGIIRGRIIVFGRQCHAGRPFAGENAIMKGIELVGELESFSKEHEKSISKLNAPEDSGKKKLWGRFSVTTFHSGEKENIIPGIAKIGFDLRTIPEQDIEEVKNEFIKFVESAAEKKKLKIQMEFFHARKGYSSNENNKYVKRMVQIIKKNFEKEGNEETAGSLGGNDGCFISAKGIPVVCCGVGRIGNNGHGIDESAVLEDIERLKRIIVEFIASK